jgi:hypothetical protein
MLTRRVRLAPFEKSTPAKSNAQFAPPAPRRRDGGGSREELALRCTESRWSLSPAPPDAGLWVLVSVDGEIYPAIGRMGC